MDFMSFIRIALVTYVMGTPFIFIYLQQSLFRDSFDDEFGSKLIVRMHFITTFACVMFFLMTFLGSEMARSVFQIK